MKKTTMKINCWKLEDGNEVPMLPTSTLDGFEWNAKYRLTVSNDDGSLGLPFVFAADDTAILTVETSEQEGMGTDDKKIKQVISCVPRSLGNEITCSRTRSYKGKEHVWSAWETVSSASGTKVTWDASSCVDTFIAAGIYNIRGERLNVNDALPIANSNPGHTISARLVVLDSSIAGTGGSHDKCVTQVLTLSNRTGGDGDVYIRTGRASIKNQLAGGTGWEPWGKLQQNIEVGQVTSLNSFTGNGIYSGVYTNGSTFFETFVMVVINNYAVAGSTGQVRCISQFKYALNVDGTFSYKTRTGQGSSVIEWGSWVDLGAATTTDIQDGAITAQKLSSEIRSNAVSPLRPLFIAAGAEYNDSGADKTKTAPWGETVTHKAGHYYLNGLGDITEEDMLAIFLAKPITSPNSSYLWAFSQFRTNLSQFLPEESHNLRKLLTTNVKIQVVNNGREIVCSNIASMFGNCVRLHSVCPILDIGQITSVANTHYVFDNTPSLVRVKVKNLKYDFTFSCSPLLDKASVLYLIQNAAPTTAITVTLHVDAYARLADDTDVVAALEAQPLISLVSA